MGKKKGSLPLRLLMMAAAVSTAIVMERLVVSVAAFAETETEMKDAAAFRPREQVPVDREDVVVSAQFAVEKLRELSDSGVFSSLDLKRIVSAATSRGVYHDNWFLKVELTSPHLARGILSAHDIIVMKSIEDGVLSLAIDEYPAMSQRSIDAFTRRKIERHKAQREVLFAEMEKDFLEGQNDYLEEV